jgi:hypothetical protein
MMAARLSARLAPVPLWVKLVFVCPLFESWLTSDPIGLSKHPQIVAGYAPHNFTNVDAEIHNHIAWLESCFVEGYRKRPGEAVKVVRELHPLRCAGRSRSFRKFWKEVTRAFSDTSELTGLEWTSAPVD